jgi:hypothetical protein
VAAVAAPAPVNPAMVSASAATVAVVSMRLTDRDMTVSPASRRPGLEDAFF